MDRLTSEAAISLSVYPIAYFGYGLWWLRNSLKMVFEIILKLLDKWLRRGIWLAAYNWSLANARIGDVKITISILRLQRRRVENVPLRFGFLEPTMSTHHSKKVPKPWPGPSSYICHSHLIKYFSSANIPSMGFRSSEYGGKYSNLNPASEKISFSRAVWWKDALSMTRTNFRTGHLLQWWSSCSTKSSKTAASVEPWKTRARTILSCVYAGRIWYLYSLRNRLIWTGVTPTGDQAVRRDPIRLSHPDSLTYTRWYERNSDSLWR